MIPALSARGARFAARCALLAAAFALATLVLGWWGVPLAAGLWGALTRGRPVATAAAALGAAAGWGALLVRAAAAAPLTSVAATLGGLLRVPAPALLAVTLFFPALLAWGAAAVAGAAFRPRRAATGAAEAKPRATTAA